MIRPDNLLPVCVDDKYGYINTRGEIVVPCQYHHASKFSEGLATVCVHFDDEEFENHEIMVIDTQLNEVGRLVCEHWGEYSEGLMDFGREDKRGYVDTSLQVIIQPSFEVVRDFVDGLATAEDSWGKWGMIDRTGQWVIPPEYESLWSFDKGERVTAFSRDNTYWGLLDRQGSVVAKPRFGTCAETSHGLTPAAIRTNNGTEKYGFVDERGEWVVTPRFDQCDGGFVNDTLGAAVKGRWGVVDREGGWMIEPRFTYAGAFHEGLSVVYSGGRRDGDNCLLDGKYGYTDSDGEFVIEPLFDDAGPFREGIAEVDVFDGYPDEHRIWKTGYIDRTGNYIWEPSR